MKQKSLITILAGLTLVGCANNPLSSYKSTTDNRLNKIYNGNLDASMQAESTTDILFNLEYGTVMRGLQSYESSNIFYGRAQASLNNWVYSWGNTTGGKITSNMTSMLVNDSANDYMPRGYEKTFLPTMAALNQLGLNNFDDARIEIKRMYQIEQATQNYNQMMYSKAQADAAKQNKDKTQSYLYKQIMQKYDFKDVNSPQVLALKNSYQNAFSQYLAGFVFEALGQTDMARPSYVKAGQLLPTNKLIQQSIDNIDKNGRTKTGYTNLLIVEETGHAPQIKSNEIHLPINLNLVGTQNSCVNMINVFYPTMIVDKNNLSSYNYSLDGQNMTPIAMTDVDLMLAKSLSDETPSIIARNISAAVRNIAIAQAACSAGGIGTLLSLGTGVGSTFIDKADERNWSLLPSKININRTTVAYGVHNISININGVNYTKQITLDKPYQIITFRVIGNRVFFDLQRSMIK